MKMIHDPFNMDTNLNFGGLSFGGVKSQSLDFGSLAFEHSMNTKLSFDFSHDISLNFDKMGMLETAKITEFEPECISLFQTNTRGRRANRRKVVHCGQVPLQNQRCVLYNRSFNDVTVSIGVSAWLND